MLVFYQDHACILLLLFLLCTRFCCFSEVSVKRLLVIWGEETSIFKIGIFIFSLHQRWRRDVWLLFTSLLLGEFWIACVRRHLWMSKAWLIVTGDVSERSVWSEVKRFLVASSDGRVLEVIKGRGVYEFRLWCFSIDVLYRSVVPLRRALLVGRGVLLRWIRVAVVLRLIVFRLFLCDLVKGQLVVCSWLLLDIVFFNVLSLCELFIFLPNAV